MANFDKEPKHEDGENIVIIDGWVRANPVIRKDRYNNDIVEFSVTTRSANRTIQTPVVCEASSIRSIATGDRVLVFGAVQTRFFVVGGRTQTRTEVVATLVAGPRARVARTKALGLVAEKLALL